MPFSNKISILVTYITLLFQLSSANVEKVIFLAPHLTPIPSENLAFDDLGLHRLSPSTPILRTYVNASFPTEDEQLGKESWFYLEDLAPGTRYEVRICWLATVRSLHWRLQIMRVENGIRGLNIIRIAST
jgi:hypothetical protein